MDGVGAPAPSLLVLDASQTSDAQGVTERAGCDLDAAFDAATQVVGACSASGSLASDQLLRFYGLYKQATQGACCTPRPGLFDRRGRAKWSAWHECRALTTRQAQQAYVDMLTELRPNWAGAPGTGGVRQAGAGGPVQSRMAQAVDDDEGEDRARSALLEAARVGDPGLVEQLLRQGANISERDSQGATCLHWAADKGHVGVLSLLLSRGADPNAVDADGLAAVHYAALAEQQAAAQLLATTTGARLDLCSSDGDTAADLAPPSWGFLLAGKGS